MAFILQIVGFKNSGKTTMMQKLIQLCKQDGYRVAVVKHDGHDFEIDHAGTDSYAFREQGADVVAIASSRQFAMMTQRGQSLRETLRLLPETDIVLIEGYKDAPFPKVVMVRSLEDFQELHMNVAKPLRFASRFPLDRADVDFVGGEEALDQFTKRLLKEIFA
ncbi:molybdopterin-guanine dinucleotide biosynthesis protein B [Listeria costaricensis]|uniref:molybdopterin-guanine dinucleotide biosynthesis protein B n=1 Tax=Listeria costaricensis TaxID=2026604 RepID=UPI000C06C053|nr:molybdopterin-guanine dinucleotide biosynthesis protein B [Listeria costaricensis]